jgi:hypothetical protein
MLDHAGAVRSSDQPLSTTTGRGPRLPVGPPTPEKYLLKRYKLSVMRLGVALLSEIS